MDDWRGTNDETHLLGTNVLIDASMLGSALKITSLGWKTSTAPTFPQRGHWNSVLCSRLNLDTYHDNDATNKIDDVFLEHGGLPCVLPLAVQLETTVQQVQGTILRFSYSFLLLLFVMLHA